MPFVEPEHDIEQEEIIHGFKVRFIHSGSMTFAYWNIAPGGLLPEHAYPHEQVANLIEGEFELTINGETRAMKAGALAIVPPNALHSGRAITACRIIDVFYPIREDYRRSNNTHLETEKV